MLNDDAFHTNLPYKSSIVWHKIGLFRYMQLAVLIDEDKESFVWVHEGDYLACESKLKFLS